MYNILSIIIGALIAVMIGFNGILSNYLGNYLSNSVIHLVGLITISLVIIISRYKFKLPKKESILIYTGGAVGVFTVISNTVSFSALGATLTVCLGLLGQVISSIIIDHFGLIGVKKVPFNPKKICSILIMITGAVIMTIY